MPAVQCLLYPRRDMPKLSTILYIVVIGTCVGVICVYAFWWLVSRYKLGTTRARRLRADRVSLWHDPGEVERLDFRAGPGGPDGSPAPPFRFVEEHSTGSNPCLSVRDAKDRTWRVKWGDEVRSETFSTRLVWAAGFHVEQAYFVAEGRIEGATTLGRARSCIDEDCRFRDARFELDEQGVRKLFDEHGWSWDENPFVGTRELSGLKIMLMLVSNWDNKDVRDVARGSNTAIFEHELPDGSIEARYLIIDWGASMGKFGSPITRSKWDCVGYEAQCAEFITGVQGGIIKWGYTGQRTDEAIEGITVDDVRWLYDYLRRITDSQLREGLRASGATEEEVECFVRAIRERINTLGLVSRHGDDYSRQNA